MWAKKNLFRVPTEPNSLGPNQTFLKPCEILKSISGPFKNFYTVSIHFFFIFKSLPTY